MKYTRPWELFRELAKKKATQQGRFLGLDVGDKYVGLALSDTQNEIASPLSVLTRTKANIDLMATDFENLISKLSIEGIIVGYPYDRQRESPDAVQVKVFIDNLCKTGKLEGSKYTYWNECFTSKLGAYSCIRKLEKELECQLESHSINNLLTCVKHMDIELMLKPLNIHPVRSKTISDKFAAVGILQGYLDYVNKKMKSEAIK